MAQVSETLYEAVLNRMNITWEPDVKQAQNIRNAIEEARGLLCKTADNYELTFESGDERTLLITCTQYIVESKRAEFEREYSGDLILLRLEEGFGCGKNTEQNKV